MTENDPKPARPPRTNPEAEERLVEAESADYARELYRSDLGPDTYDRQVADGRDPWLELGPYGRMDYRRKAVHDLIRCYHYGNAGDGVL